MRRLTADRRVLAAIALLGLLLVGLGAYAIFREVLRAPIQVETGRFDFDIQNVEIEEFAGNQPENPNIAECTYSIAPNGKSVQISISNAYPGYRCEITLVFINDPVESSIPGRFEGRQVIGSPADWLSITYQDPDPNVMIVEGGTAQAKIIIEVTAQAPENGSSSFTVDYTFRQYLP
ncbi:MAG: hypothetical protein N3D79_01640 [Acidilobaceae archaeon]|nr:hypothetical protein [Acidilobaceae archaeon]